MSVSSGPGLVTSGLILNLDIATRQSFLPSAGSQPSLIDTANWTVSTGAVTGYPVNGLASESQRIVDTDPWGNQNIVWGTYASGDGGADGGWEGTAVAADRTKTYRYSVWVRRTSSTATGTFYFGLHTNGTGDTYHLSDGASQTNPYWDYRGTGSLTQNQWYLVVGHIFPTGYAGTTAHPNSGYYTVANGTTKVASNAGNVPNDVKFPSDATTLMSRVYHYYCSDATTRLQFAYPRIDIVDGNEPTISELLSKDSGVLYDTSGYNNHHLITPYYVPNSFSPRKFTTDGSTMGFTKASALAGATSACTVVLWYSTTDTQELWVMGNQNGAYYVSASVGNNYYHGTCGSPTNYVDLAVTVRPDTPINYRDGNYHMWEAKGVDFSAWSYYQWFLYPGGWQMAGNVSKIMVYNRVLTSAESAQNHWALRSRFGI
jgi:hypothetical protein